MATSCLTVAGRREQVALLHVSMATGELQELGRFGSGVDGTFQVTGLARRENELVMAARGANDYEDEARYVKLDLTTGTMTKGMIAPDSEWSVTASADSYITPDGVFSSFDTLNAGVPSMAFDLDLSPLSPVDRLAVHGRELYASWFSTDSVEVYDLGSGEWLREIVLQAYDDWVWGISIAGGALHMINDGRGDDAQEGVRIARFDACSGEFLGDVFLDDDPLSFGPSGLWCEVE